MSDLLRKSRRGCARLVCSGTPRACYRNDPRAPPDVSTPPFFVPGLGDGLLYFRNWGISIQLTEHTGRYKNNRCKINRE